MKDKSLQEVKAAVLRAEVELRAMRRELMTPAEVEYIYVELIFPKLPDLAYDGERAKEAAIRLLIRETADNYILERERRHDLGLPPLVPNDIDKPREGGNEPSK